MTCPKCSKDNPGDAIFCARCGERLHKAQPRVCPRCATANDPIFQFCRACKTDLDDPPERYILDEPEEKRSDYKPQTTPFAPQTTLYSVHSTPFVPEPKLNAIPPDMFEIPPGPAFDPQLEPVYDPAPDIPFEPPVIAPNELEFGQGALRQGFDYGQDDPFAINAFAPDADAAMGMETAKRKPRRLKWLLICALVLCALAFAGAGVFAYLERVEQSGKPSWELDVKN